MSDDSINYEPGVLRVLQGKGETKAFYNKIAKVYDLLSEHSEKAMREAGIKMLAPLPGEHLLEHWLRHRPCPGRACQDGRAIRKSLWHRHR